MRRLGADERERTRRGLHLVRRGDVVLEQNRDAVEGAAHLAGPALVVQLLRECERVRIELDHGIQLRPGLIYLGDAVEIGLGQLHRGQPAASHLRLQILYRRLGEGELRPCHRYRETEHQQKSVFHEAKQTTDCTDEHG
jgi:hypothetical protein